MSAFHPKLPFSNLVGRLKASEIPVLHANSARICCSTSTTPFDWAEFEEEASDPANHIAFDPVPRRRVRRNGWTPERQQLFLFALSRCGSVARAIADAISSVTLA